MHLRAVQLSASYNFSMGVFNNGDLYVWGWGLSNHKSNYLIKKLEGHQINVREIVLKQEH